jgi:hypothetical protein
VPAAVPAFTCKAKVKLLEVVEPPPKVGFVHVIVPALPTAGVAHDHPAGTLMD